MRIQVIRRNKSLTWLNVHYSLFNSHICFAYLNKQESQMAYGTADIMTESCDWASLPFIGTIFRLNWFTQNITYLITPFNIHMPIAEGINIAQRWAKI